MKIVIRAAISVSLANFRVLNWKKWLEMCPSLTGSTVYNL